MGNVDPIHDCMVTRSADEPPGRIRSKRDRGFTLVELVVASTLIVIVMGAVYSSFSVALQTWRGGETNYKTYEDARLVMGLLSRELQGIPPSTIHLFNGTRSTMEFYTLASPLNEVKGKGERVLWVRYRMMAGRGRTGGTLFREEAIVTGPLPAPRRPGEPVDMSRIKKGPMKRFEIATGVTRFQLGYYWSPLIRASMHVQPEQVEMFVEDRVRAALPHGVGITLGVYDESGDFGESTFDHVVAFRGITSRLPEALREESRRLYP